MTHDLSSGVQVFVFKIGSLINVIVMKDNYTESSLHLK